MAITQARMLSLLAAAQDFQQALAKITDQCDVIRAQLTSGLITEAEALEQFKLHTIPMLALQFPMESPAIIKLETAHFAREARRNERKAEKARENRAAQRDGLPKPDRGNGAQFGKLGSNSRGINRSPVVALPIRPSIEASAPHSSAMRIPRSQNESLSWEGARTAEPEVDLTPARQFTVRPGFQTPEKFCSHPRELPNGQCMDCGRARVSEHSNAAQLEALPEFGSDLGIEAGDEHGE